MSAWVSQVGGWGSELVSVRLRPLGTCGLRGGGRLVGRGRPGPLVDEWAMSGVGRGRHWPVLSWRTRGPLMPTQKRQAMSKYVQ